MAQSVQICQRSVLMWGWLSALVSRRQRLAIHTQVVVDQWWLKSSVEVETSSGSQRRYVFGSEGDRVTGWVNKTFLGNLYRLRRGVMVRMRRGESTLKVQWRDLVGIEGCLQRRLRIL
ncbi:unnamed protein product, partial [Brassica oleracea]